MKRFLPIFLLLILTIAACKKGGSVKNETGGPEPIPPKILSRDTLTSGNLWGIAIGQDGADIYASLQAMRVERTLGGMGIANNFYNSLDALENKIPLYNSIFLDEMRGTSTGIQIGFVDDKVKTIYNNNGVQMGLWPYDNDASSTIKVGDAVSTVYQKLVNIKNQPANASKFERISIFSKDLTKAYDPQMGTSPQWYFISVVNDKIYNQVQLIFTAGKLTAIYSTVFQSQY